MACRRTQSGEGIRGNDPRARRRQRHRHLRPNAGDKGSACSLRQGVRTMSFEIYISCFRDGEPSTSPRALAEKAFGSCITSKKDDPSWVLTFPDGGKSELNLGPGLEIDGFMMNRSSGSPELRNGIVEILKRTSSPLLAGRNHGLRRRRRRCDPAPTAGYGRIPRYAGRHDG